MGARPGLQFPDIADRMVAELAPGAFVTTDPFHQLCRELETRGVARIDAPDDASLRLMLVGRAGDGGVTVLGDPTRLGRELGAGLTAVVWGEQSIATSSELRGLAELAQNFGLIRDPIPPASWRSAESDTFAPGNADTRARAYEILLAKERVRSQPGQDGDDRRALLSEAQRQLAAARAELAVAEASLRTYRDVPYPAVLALASVVHRLRALKQWSARR